MRVPWRGPKLRDRRELIERYTKALRRFQRVPPHRREAEHADIGEEICRAMLRELGGEFDERHPVPDQMIKDELEELLKNAPR